MAGEVELYCDLDAMEVLASQLRSIETSLANVGVTVDSFDARLGSPRLEEALDAFISGWKQGRQKIREAVSEAAARVEGAANAYKVIEAKISTAASGSAPQ